MAKIIDDEEYMEDEDLYEEDEEYDEDDEDEDDDDDDEDDDDDGDDDDDYQIDYTNEEYVQIDDTEDDDDEFYDEPIADSLIEIKCDESICDDVIALFYEELAKRYKKKVKKVINSFPFSYTQFPDMEEEEDIEYFCDDDLKPVKKSKQKSNKYYTSNLNIKEICKMGSVSKGVIKMYSEKDLTAYSNNNRVDNFEGIFFSALRVVRKMYPDISYEVEIYYSYSDVHCGETIHYKVKSK